MICVPNHRGVLVIEIFTLWNLSTGEESAGKCYGEMITRKANYSSLAPTQWLHAGNKRQNLYPIK